MAGSYAIVNSARAVCTIPLNSVKPRRIEHQSIQ